MLRPPFLSVLERWQRDRMCMASYPSPSCFFISFIPGQRCCEDLSHKRSRFQALSETSQVFENVVIPFLPFNLSSSSVSHPSRTHVCFMSTVQRCRNWRRFGYQMSLLQPVAVGQSNFYKEQLVLLSIGHGRNGSGMPLVTKSLNGHQRTRLMLSYWSMANFNIF